MTQMTFKEKLIAKLTDKHLDEISLTKCIESIEGYLSRLKSDLAEVINAGGDVRISESGRYVQIENKRLNFRREGKKIIVLNEGSIYQTKIDTLTPDEYGNMVCEARQRYFDEEVFDEYLKVVFGEFV